MTNYDYTYTNTQDAFNVVKFTLDGEFVIIGNDVDDETLAKMENMEDISGWECE